MSQPPSSWICFMRTDLDVVKLSLSGDRCLLEKLWSGVESRVGGREIPVVLPRSLLSFPDPCCPSQLSEGLKLGRDIRFLGFPLCFRMCHGTPWENPSEEPEPFPELLRAGGGCWGKKIEIFRKNYGIRQALSASLHCPRCKTFCGRGWLIPR